MKQPLKWHGGKYYLARWIISHFCPHLHYVEPYVGAGAVLFARKISRDWYQGAKDWRGSAEQRGCSEVINDIDGDLMNFYTVISDKELFFLFRDRVALQPFSERIYDLSRWTLENSEDTIERAVAFFQLMRMSRQGLGEDFATLSRNRTRARINEQVNAYLSAVDGLYEVHLRLKSVVIYSRPALDVIRSQVGPRTLFYLDPPYVLGTRTAKQCYRHEMTDKDHEDLLELLSTKLNGSSWLLSGYPSDLYDYYAKKNFWYRADHVTANHASSRKKKNLMTECLWANYPLRGGVPCVK